MRTKISQLEMSFDTISDDTPLALIRAREMLDAIYGPDRVREYTPGMVYLYEEDKRQRGLYTGPHKVRGEGKDGVSTTAYAKVTGIFRLEDHRSAGVLPREGVLPERHTISDFERLIDDAEKEILEPMRNLQGYWGHMSAMGSRTPVCPRGWTDLWKRRWDDALERIVRDFEDPGCTPTKVSGDDRHRLHLQALRKLGLIRGSQHGAPRGYVFPNPHFRNWLLHLRSGRQARRDARRQRS